MVKIIIMDEEEVYRQTIRDVEQRRYQKEDHIIYFSSLEEMRKVLTTERVRMLRTIREKKPSSLYALAKVLGTDFKNVQVNARFLEACHLISLQKVRTGRRVSLKPVSKIKSLEATIAI